MSGICGVCEAGAQFLRAELEPMLGGIALAGEGTASALAARGALFGVSPRWNFQVAGSRNGILAAVSTDLCNVSSLIADVKAKSSWNGNSVAELIAELYGLYGLGFLEKLDGSFAIALWDAGQQELVLAVDRLGLETLYWARDGGRVLFASRVAAIAGAKPECDIDPAALVQFLLYTVVPAPMTIYRDIQRLEPGTVLRWKKSGDVATKKYWDLSYEESVRGSTASWAERLRTEMRRAVHSNLSDCHREQTGAYLSGGTDSSSILAFASELQDPFNTFSIYFENPRYDEIGFARTAAERFHANHHERCLSAQDAVQSIPAIVDYFDEPFANSSAIGAFHCARLARENGVEVLLAGDGGDELFAGNERYASDKKFENCQILIGRFRTHFSFPRWQKKSSTTTY
jgi:asparagine synthase (glutamine-hydrolysing)